MNTLVIISTISFGGALVAYALAALALRHARVRQHAADPYAIGLVR